MADKGGIQLLSESRKSVDIKVPGENRLLNIGIGALVFVGVIWGGLMLYQSHLSNKLSDIDGQLLALENNRDKKTEQSLLTFKKQAELISQMLKSHLYWTEGFAKIESLISPQIQLETFNASSDTGLVEFKALALNYTAIAKQIAAFSSNDTVEDVMLDSINTLTNGRLEFNMKIKFKPEVFLTKKQ